MLIRSIQIAFYRKMWNHVIHLVTYLFLVVKETALVSHYIPIIGEDSWFSVGQWIMRIDNFSGYQYAMRSIKVILSAVLRRYRFTTNLSLPGLELKYEISLKLANKHMVALDRRIWWNKKEIWKKEPFEEPFMKFYEALSDLTSCSRHENTMENNPELEINRGHGFSTFITATPRLSDFLYRCASKKPLCGNRSVL